MLRSFRDKGGERVRSREQSHRLDLFTQRAALRKLLIFDAADLLGDLRVPPGNHLEKLRGKRADERRIRVTAKWRIRFRWAPAGPDQVEIVDHH